MYKKLITGVSLVTSFMLSAQSQALEIGKPITEKIHIIKPGLQAALSQKEVVLMGFKLSKKERETLFNYPLKKSSLDQINAPLPTSINLDMNGVPVLDQGHHGSCVTFAATAAVDATLAKGDYVSQLCQLELGSYLEKDSYLPSGWSGSFAPWVFDQMMRYGIVNTENQKTKGCAEIREYPVKAEENEGNPMSSSEYKQMSEDLNEKLYPVYLMNFFQRLDSHFSDSSQASKVLLQVKELLAKGRYATLGTFLILAPQCSAGACATYRTQQDTWALTKEIEDSSLDVGGHEMVITGYDDKAVALDQAGKKHQGLLTLRNSWSADAGDHGNFYMTYDYFKKFVGEVVEIVKVKEDNLA